MSYLGIALQRTAQQNRLTQREISDASGVAKTQVALIFSGARAWVSDKDFASLVLATAKTARERAELVAARCEDVRNGPGADQVEITIKGKPRAADPEPPVRLPHNLERALSYVREQIPLNPALADFVLNQAKLLGMK